MVCIHCLHPKTQVINSRSNKNLQVWRRRQCLKCKKIFTTHERVAAHDEFRCQNTAGKLSAYNFGKLLLDIAACFDHLPEERAEKAYWLAKTVEDKLLRLGTTTLSTALIAKTIHHTMLPFDKPAALQFAARYHKFNLL